jgi:hypothetical protein
MGEIRTIYDLQHASPSEIKEAKKQVTVLDDLYDYLQWLNSPKGEQVTIQFQVGYNGASREGSIHPSTIAKPTVCLLKVYFELTGEVEPDRDFDGRTILIWDIGTAMHGMLQGHFEAMYDVQFEAEKSLKNGELEISSHADGAFDFPRVRFTMEIKSIKEGGSFGWEKIQNKPFPDNIRQLTCYMATDDSPFGLILYFCKNTSELKEHVVEFDQKIWDSLQNKTILPVLQAAEKKKRPVATPGWHCKQCQYQHGCPQGQRSKHDQPSRFAKRIRQLRR